VRLARDLEAHSIHLMRVFDRCAPGRRGGRRDAADSVYVADASCHGAIGRRRVLQFGPTVPIIPGCRV